MLTKFDPGVAYRFHECTFDKNRDNFVAVAAARNEEKQEVEFIIPADLIQGEVSIFDGRECVKVRFNDRDYCASSAAALDVSVAFDILEQIRNVRLGKTAK